MWISKVVVTLWNYLVKNFGNTLGWAIWLPELLLLPAFFLLLAAGIRNRKLPASLLAYGFCYLIANYSLSWLISGGRYLSCGFVFFLFLAALTENRPTLRRLLLAGEAVFLGCHAVRLCLRRADHVSMFLLTGHAYMAEKRGRRHSQSPFAFQAFSALPAFLRNRIE